MIEQMMVEFPIYLVNHAKTRKSERLPKNCLATDVASALTAASRMFFFFFAIEYNISKSNNISRLSVSYAQYNSKTLYVLHYCYYSLWNNLE